MALTDVKIRNAKPLAKQYRLADGNGLYLQVAPNGTKLWRYRYVFAGKEKMLALGVYPDVTLANARDRLLSARRDVAHGVDPSQKKQAEKKQAALSATNTFSAIATEWHGKTKPKWSADHADRIWRRIEKYLLPAFGKLPIAEISALDVLDTIRKVEERDATELSRRLHQTCSQIFRYAIVTKRISHNPSADLRGALKAHKAKNYPRIDAKEIPTFLERLEAVGTSEQNRLAIRLMLLTFVRTIELRRAKWTNIDLKAREWRLPPDDTKSGRLHIVPLSDQAVTVLQKLKVLTGGKELLCPPQMRCKHPLMSENTINQVIKRMGYKGKMVGHGFRGVASTALHEIGNVSDVIERQLDHKVGNQVLAAYNHAQYLPQRRKMMQDWANYIDGLVEAKNSIQANAA